MHDFAKFLLFFTVVATQASLASAAQTNLLGLSCSPTAEVGTTRLDNDGVNIVGCLWDDSIHKSAHWKSVNFNISTLSCPDGQALVRVTNGLPVCMQLTPFIAGGVDMVYEEQTSIFGYCRLAWGSISSCNEAGVVCGRGKPRVTTSAHDKIFSSEDYSYDHFISQGTNGAHINHIDCVVE